MSQAYINPAIITWGRTKRMNLPLGALAEKIKQPPEKLQAWEHGTARPTIGQAQKLAKALRMPFGYLFLSKPPKEPVPIADFRRLPDTDADISVDLREVIYNVQLKQERYKELIQDYATSVSIVGRFRDNFKVAEVAEYLRESLLIAQLQSGSADQVEFVRALVQRAEQVGILVMRSSIVGNNAHRKLRRKEFRGFAISDPIAPVVFINTEDTDAPQVFTLLHEIAHIAVGSTGISDQHEGSTGTQVGIEKFCNAVAAEALIPSHSFTAAWSDHRSFDDNVTALRLRFRVSSMVVLRRAYDLKKLTQPEFRVRYDAAVKAAKVVKKKSRNGGDFNKYLLPARNSRTLTSTLVGAALEGRIMYREAANLLNIRPAVIPSVAKAIGVTATQ